MTRHALISGASVAGPAIAHDLAARGWRTTVVERAPQLRDEGQNVDVRGAAREVVRRMGIDDAVREAGTGEVGLRFVDDDGGVVAEFPVGEDGHDGPTAELEILRGEMSRILYERTRDRTEYRFGEQITGLTDHGDHVTAALDGGGTLDADVVVVAEGTRSRTRERVLPGADVAELGMHLAYLTLPRTADDDRWWRWHSAARCRSVSIRPDNRGTTRAFLAFLSDVRGLDRLDRADQVMILRRTFADAGWQAPRILDALDDAPLYFDSVAQVRLPRWSSGRTVLLGDAAWSSGPFGTGTGMALIGAHVLAGELGAGDDTLAALARYEWLMRPWVTKAQGIRPSMLRVMNPRTKGGRAVQRTALGVVGSLYRRVGGPPAGLARTPLDTIELPDYPLVSAA